MRLKNLLTLFVLVAVLAGCKSDSTTSPTPTTTGPIVPLKEGNTWNYKTYFTFSGIKQDAGQDYSAVVEEAFTMGGEDWFLVKNLLPETESNFRAASDGLRTYEGDFNDYTSTKSALVFKYPATAGSTYTDVDGTTVTVVSTSAKVDANGKSYTCYQYKIPSSEGDINFYVAPNVGVVKIAGTTPNPNGGNIDVSTELQSYTLK